MHCCEVCGAHVSELRRNRCWGCYSRWVEARPVGLGATCCICGERRRAYLKSVELLRAWVPMCHNCAGRVARIKRMPGNFAAVRKALRRERRRADRRAGLPDARAFPSDRRTGDRREGDGGDMPPVDDDMIVEVSELVLDFEAELLCRSDTDTSELTRIHDTRARGADAGSPQ